jgi:Zn-dependent membrane protease YugP
MDNKKKKVTRKLRAAGNFALRTGRKYGPAALLMLAAVGARAAGDASGEVEDMWTQEIKPLVSKILNVAIGISVAWVAIMFFMGKKTALTIGGFVLLGAVIFRLFPQILGALMGIEVK